MASTRERRGLRARIGGPGRSSEMRRPPAAGAPCALPGIGHRTRHLITTFRPETRAAAAPPPLARHRRLAGTGFHRPAQRFSPASDIERNAIDCFQEFQMTAFKARGFSHGLLKTSKRRGAGFLTSTKGEVDVMPRFPSPTHHRDDRPRPAKPCRIGSGRSTRQRSNAKTRQAAGGTNSPAGSPTAAGIEPWNLHQPLVLARKASGGSRPINPFGIGMQRVSARHPAPGRFSAIRPEYITATLGRRFFRRSRPMFVGHQPSRRCP